MSQAIDIVGRVADHYIRLAFQTQLASIKRGYPNKSLTAENTLFAHVRRVTSPHFRRSLPA